MLIAALLVLGVVAVVWIVARGATGSGSEPARKPIPPAIRSLFDAEAERLRREADAAVPDLMRQVEADAVALMPEIEAEAARLHAEMLREVEREVNADAEPLDADDDPGPGVVTRDMFAPKDAEARYLTRDADGLPTVRLVDAGDRLAIWSPLDGGALINPKGPGLRQRLGLCTSYARGSDHYASAYRDAHLSKGRWVDLKREPDNPHDRNAVAMCPPGSGVGFGYVSRGRAATVARRMDGGEDMAGVTIWGPPRGSVDRSTLVLIGSRADLEAMLKTE